MGPEGAEMASSAFLEKLPPSFDGHSSYAVYGQYIELWLLLISLEAPKRGPDLIGRLSGEAKASAKNLGIDTISSQDGATRILEHLNKSYGVDKIDQLDIDLSTFLEYTWRSHMTVEHFIAGFHSRID